jgi:predicted RNA binding protein YcfA (HicA-like mRNA interferase family)
MRLPRDVSGASLAKALGSLGYRLTRQTGSHMRLTCDLPAQHHITIPAHDQLRIGTLSAIPGDVAAQQGLSRDELLVKLFGR